MSVKNFGMKLIVALVVVAVLFAAQSVFDGNIAMAAGPTCAIPSYDPPANGGKGDVHIEWNVPDPSGDIFVILVDYITGMKEQDALTVAYRQERFVTGSGNVFGSASVDTGRYIMVGHYADQWTIVGLLDIWPDRQNRPTCLGNPFAVVEVAPPAVTDEKEVTKVVTETVLAADAIVRPDVDPCARMRQGPGVDYERVTCLAPGKELQVTGKNADGSWIQVSSNAGKGWVSAELLTVSVDLTKVAVIEVVPPAEVAAGAVVTPTTIVTTTVTITPTVKSLCDRCWEMRLETAVVTETIATTAKLNQPITLTAESVVIVSADGKAELLVYVENTTVLKQGSGTSILATKTASIKNRGVKYVVRTGDTVSDIIEKVRGADWKVTEDDILKLVTGNPDAFEMTIDGGGNIVFAPVPGAVILFGCPGG